MVLWFHFVSFNASTIPGLIAERKDSEFAQLIDASSQLITAPLTGLKNPKGILKAARDFTTNPDLLNTLGLIDVAFDAYGFAEESKNALLGSEDLKGITKFKTKTTTTTNTNFVTGLETTTIELKVRGRTKNGDSVEITKTFTKEVNLVTGSNGVDVDIPEE